MTSSTATTQSVTHTCGHVREANISGKRPFEVDGFVKWLKSKPCRDCDPKEKSKRDTWVAARRKEELQQAREAEKRFGFDSLTGPPKLIEWATKIRVQMVGAAWDALGLDEDKFAVVVGTPAGKVDAAGWWVDHREQDASQLPQLLAKALGEPLEGGLENPFA